MLFLDPLIRGLVNLKSYAEPGQDGQSAPTRPKVIAHRGCWGRGTLENTMPAFEKAQILGASGIELDIRFSKDRIPMINHDAHLNRIFKIDQTIGEHNYQDLQKAAPLLPSLDQALRLKNLHFMIEVKEPLSTLQKQVLEEQLGNLQPGNNFHLLTLNPELVFTSKWIPSTAWILVAQLHVNQFIELALKNNYGGVAGHYFLMKDKQIQILKNKNKIVGTGFIPNKNMFNREWARGIDFVFTDNLEQLL